MTRREVVRMVLEGKTPPYVPWHFGFTQKAWAKLDAHGTSGMEDLFRGHLAQCNSDSAFTELDNDMVRDAFGVVWDRSRDKDIGVVHNCVLSEPTMAGYTFPDPTPPELFKRLLGMIEEQPDLFRVFGIGFSLYERAWTLRGMENLMMDFIEHPAFVHELLEAIADYNIAQIHEALKYDIDAVHFGDDWGQQQGLQMGPAMWKEFIYPQLKRMYGVVREAGKFVTIHSCGKVDELFDDLIDIGLNCFNPFQPEVMDVEALLKRYRGRLAFHGGLSTQKTLPYGTPDEVRAETRRLFELGRAGSYIFAPAHGVPGDVPLENLLAFIETVAEQPRQAE